MIKTQPVYNPLYLNKDKFITILSGGRASGKSFAASTFLERLSFEAGHKILFSRYTMVSAHSSIIPEFEEKIEAEGTQAYFNVTKTAIKNTFSGSEILFKGIKTSSGNQTANLKSLHGITTFVGDEMEEWLSEEDYEKLILSIRQKGIQLRVILILNPSNAEHFIYKKYIEQTHKIVNIDGVEVQISTHPDVLHIHTTYFDNKENLNEQFFKQIDEIKAQSLAQATDEQGNFSQSLFNKTKYAQKIIGRWADVSEGVIFTDWEIGAFDTSLPYGYGQDYGFSIDPDTLIKVAVDKRRKIIYIDEKYYNNKQLSSDGLYQLNSTLIDNPNDLIIADSAEPRLIADLRDKGLNIEPCEKGAGSVSAGITTMLNYKLVITSESFNVMKELKNYAWNDKKSGIPIDNHNHSIDAIRYITMRLLSGTNNNLYQLASMI